MSNYEWGLYVQAASSRIRSRYPFAQAICYLRVGLGRSLVFLERDTNKTKGVRLGDLVMQSISPLQHVVIIANMKTKADQMQRNPLLFVVVIQTPAKANSHFCSLRPGYWCNQLLLIGTYGKEVNERGNTAFNHSHDGLIVILG